MNSYGGLIMNNNEILLLKLGEVVLKGITQMKIGLGFEGGIAVVILAIVLDRITQGIAQMKK